MKRYEKMSKEDIVKAISNCVNCKTCAAYDSDVGGCKEPNELCEIVIAKWLMADVEMKPRFKTLDSCEDIVSLVNDVYANVGKCITNGFAEGFLLDKALSYAQLFRRIVIEKLTEKVEVTK